MSHPLSRRIRDVLALSPDGHAIEYEGHWWSWRDVGQHAERIATVVSGPVQVAILLRNTPAHVATVLGVVMAGGTVVVINPGRGDDRTRSDLTALELPIVVGTEADIGTLVTGSDATAVVRLSELGDAISVQPAAVSTSAVQRPGVAVRMLTSGTTGPPKRIDLTYDMLTRSVLGANPASAPTAPRRGVAIVNAPLVHIGGVYRILQCVTEARPFVLLPRFELTSWVAAVRAHRPKAVSLVPAALRTVLHSDLTRDDLASLRVVTSGTAPLSADDADAFTEKFGVPVLTSYAATEFGGGVAGWTLADHQRYWKAKRGSVGRATLGARLRVVDEDGAECTPGETGLLEVKPGQLGPDADWIRTTDRAHLDVDGFLWIVGRADQAIIRGGFKVSPDEVRAALESHPAVQGAAVIGWPDLRLGETPVAMVELRGAATTEELTAFLRTRMAPYEIPTAVAIVGAIPRTPSGKADLGAVRRHFTAAASSARVTVGSVLAEQARVRSEHALLVCDADRLSYAAAERRSALVARGLVALGAGKGTHVGLLHPNGPDFVVGMLAAARIGAVTVPFTTFSTVRELGDQLAASDVAILLAARSFRSHDYAARLGEALGVDAFGVSRRLFCVVAPQVRHVVFDLNDVAALADTVDAALLTALEDDVDGSDALAIVYTSGSTGAPKGAVHTHGSLLTHQQNLNAVRGLSNTDVLFCNSPFFWIGGFAFGLLATIVAGSTLVCSNAREGSDTLDLLEAERPTVTNGFATTVAHLARHPSFGARDLTSMRRGNLYPLLAEEVRPDDPELRHNMLGMTEAGGTLLLSGDESDQPEYRRGSFGRAAPGFQTEIVDPETARPVDMGAAGELKIRGPHLMQHYYGHSREESFEPDGWFATGDVVCTDVDGFVYFLGRRSAMIKTAGANVSPAEVERVIAAVTGGAVAAHVLGIPDRERGEVVAAAVVVDDPAAFDDRGLRAALTSKLSTYKIPRRIVALAASDVPLLSSGKVDYRRLRSVFDA